MNNPSSKENKTESRVLEASYFFSLPRSMSHLWGGGGGGVGLATSSGGAEPTSSRSNATASFPATSPARRHSALDLAADRDG